MKPNEPINPCSSLTEAWGLRIRDYIAIQAMNTLIPEWFEGGMTSSEIVAQQSYELADALIKESQK